jgi:hypothetical protein
VERRRAEGIKEGEEREERRGKNSVKLKKSKSVYRNLG